VRHRVCEWEESSFCFKYRPSLNELGTCFWAEGSRRSQSESRDSIVEA
jgi:hypothetical protein